MNPRIRSGLEQPRGFTGCKRRRRARPRGSRKESYIKPASVQALAVVSLAVATSLGCRSTYPPTPAPERAPSDFTAIVDVPRDRQIPVGIAFHDATLKTVESRFEPNPEAVAKASAKHPTRMRWMQLRFRYANPGWSSWKVSVRAALLSENGAVLAEGGRQSALDADETDDTITVNLHLRTADWGEAKHLRVSAAFVE